MGFVTRDTCIGVVSCDTNSCCLREDLSSSEVPFLWIPHSLDVPEALENVSPPFYEAPSLLQVCLPRHLPLVTPLRQY